MFGDKNLKLFINLHSSSQDSSFSFLYKNRYTRYNGQETH